MLLLVSVARRLLILLLINHNYAIDIWSPSSVDYITDVCTHPHFSYTIVVGDPSSNEYTIDNAIIAVCGPSFVDHIA